jgi:Xaa-Pro aminopeptidase
MKERDRRWKSIMSLLDKNQLDALLVFGVRSFNHYETYLTDDESNSVVIFPRDGQAIRLLASGAAVMRAKVHADRGEAWITDLRVGLRSLGLIQALRDKGLQSSTIGVVGLETGSITDSEGFIPYNTWFRMLSALPNARFVSVSSDYEDLMQVKSEEELEMIRESARIGELCNEVLIKMFRSGVSEREIYAEIMKTIYGNSGESKLMIFQTASNGMVWGHPAWVHGSSEPRIIARGDYIQTEFSPVYQNYDTQQNTFVALEPVPDVIKKCAAVAEESYRAGLKCLRPGITLGQLEEAMERPVTEKEFYYIAPFAHTMNPFGFGNWLGRQSSEGKIGQVRASNDLGFGTSATRGAEIKIRANMSIEFQAQAYLADTGMQIGGTMLTTESGAIELNPLSAKVHIIK